MGRRKKWGGLSNAILLHFVLYKHTRFTVEIP